MAFDPTIEVPEARQTGEKSKRKAFDPTLDLVSGIQSSFTTPKTLKDKAIAIVSGKDSREFDYPEIGASPEYGGLFNNGQFNTKGLAATVGMQSSTRPTQEIDILRKHYPDAIIQQDKHGNPIVEFPSGKYYLNRPGLSPRDITKPAYQAGMYYLAARGANKVLPVESLLGQASITGGSAAAASLGLDAISSAEGSNQGLNVPQAGLNAIVAGGFELMRPILSPIWRALTAKGKVPSAPEARTALIDAGFNPDELTDDAVNYFIRQSQRALDPKAAGIMAEAETLPVRVPLKRGQVTGSSRQQMLEDSMEKGVYGDAAETAMKGRTAQTQEALRENIPAIQEKIGGQGVQRGQGAASAQQSLVRKMDKFGRAVDDAYEAARATDGATIPAKAASALYDDVARSADDFLEHTTVAQKELTRLKNLVSSTGKKSGLVDAKGNPLRSSGEMTTGDIKKLYDWRRRVSKLAANASDRTEAKALKEMKTQFDRNMQIALESDLLEGNTEAIKAWHRAIKLRAIKGDLFESGDLVSALVEKEYKGGGLRLKVAPEAAGNYIFGKSNLGIVNKPEMARELRRLQQVLGANSPEWNAIREEAFIRLASAGEGAFVGGERGFSGVGIKKAWLELTSKNSEVVNTLFTQEEKKLISQFANVAARATNPAKGGANYSNTAAGLAGIVQKIGGFLAFGERGQAVLSRIFPAGYNAVQAGRAFSSAKGGLPVRQMPAGLAGTIGVGATTAYPSSSNQ